MLEVYSIINTIGDNYIIGNDINNIIGKVLIILFAYNAIYYLIGLFFTRKFKPAKNYHKYGILIAARNEEIVIGNLLDSINKQDYPRELLTVFVVADNCTDNTAEIAKKYGAIVYERHDLNNKTKGYALQFLLKNIDRDYGSESFEGYFIFDADNLLNKNYVSKMNDAFDSGAKIITSYRNTKNFDENWIASTYAIHWLRSIRAKHRARSVLRLATNIQGTGFLFANEIVKNGWNYTGLTEDRALTADAVARGYQITYQDEAEFFDEQPTSLKVALRQRLRWSKGHLLAFLETGPKLFINIFFGKFFIKDKWGIENKKRGFFGTLVESIRHRFASYDTLIQLTPFSILNLFRWAILDVFMYACFTYNYGYNVIIFGKVISVKSGIDAFLMTILITLFLRLTSRISFYLVNTINAIYVFIVERYRIKKISFWKKVLYILTWPTFDLIGIYTTYLALFVKVTWKPIPHTSKITIDDVDTK